VMFEMVMTLLRVYMKKLAAPQSKITSPDLPGHFSISMTVVPRLVKLVFPWPEYTPGMK